MGRVPWILRRVLAEPSELPACDMAEPDSPLAGNTIASTVEHVRGARQRRAWAHYLRTSVPGPPQTVRVLVLAGDMEVIEVARGVVTNDKLDYQSTFNEFNDNILHLTQLRTIVVWPNIKGGLWADLWQSLARVPRLYRLDLKSVWFTPDLGVSFELGPAKSTLQFVTYSVAMVSLPVERRDAEMLALETNNLRQVLLGCSSTLEGVLLPGELLFRVIDQSVQWHALQELVVRGFWPLDPDGIPPSPLPNPRTHILRLLERLPELKILRLNVSAEYRDPRNSTYIVGPDHSGPRDPTTFLRHLTCFHFGSLLKSERILSFLPHGLQDLALVKYPLMHEATLQQPELRASSILAIFREVEFPNLRILDAHYAVDNSAEADAEEALLALFANKFAAVQQLSLSRLWYHTNSTLISHWNPVPRFRTLLSRLPALEYFQFDPCVPERHGMVPFTYVDDAFLAHVERLRRLARDIVQDCPWLQAIGLYREFRSDPQFHWERWRVVPGRNGEVQLEGIPS
uniref:F-box domain-containing protein n=1 Tax=Mycena chlorophos TaxID=658473 RepID=A0ABQ0M6D6_MYCCL|nr:predicted protein [Mycena chlorophos]